MGFISGLAEELEGHLEIYRNSNKNEKAIKYALKSLDSHLASTGAAGKDVPVETADSWLKTRSIKSGTRSSSISSLRGFKKRLASISRSMGAAWATNCPVGLAGACVLPRGD
jgi:hypothetical protein